MIAISFDNVPMESPVAQIPMEKDSFLRPVTTYRESMTDSCLLVTAKPCISVAGQPPASACSLASKLLSQ